MFSQTFDIPYFSGTQVKDVSGRTIKADGAIVELKKEAVFDREVVRFGGLKLKSKSFAMPGVEPGAIVGRRSSLLLTDAKRQHPIVLESQAYSETVRVKLPAGFDVDEIPDAAEMNQPFGNYAAKFEVKDGHLIFRRTLVLKHSQIPVEQYAAVRSFFQRIYAVEQAPVVLAKK